MSFDNYKTKIAIYENGISIISPIFKRNKIFAHEDIKHTNFRRINREKMVVVITPVKGKSIRIKTHKFVNSEPAIEYLSQFKQVFEEIID